MKVLMAVGAPNEKDKDQKRFDKEAAEVIMDLMKDFNLRQEEDFREASGNPEGIESALSEIFLEWEQENILLIYTGHGQENSLALSGYQDQEVLEYDFFKALLTLHKGNLIFLNSCCYAFAGKTAIDYRDNALFIAALPADRIGGTDRFFKEIFQFWKNSKPARFGLLEAGHFVPLWYGDEKLNELMYPIKTPV